MTIISSSDSSVMNTPHFLWKAASRTPMSNQQLVSSSLGVQQPFTCTCAWVCVCTHTRSTGMVHHLLKFLHKARPATAISMATGVPTLRRCSLLALMYANMLFFFVNICILMKADWHPLAVRRPVVDRFRFNCNVPYTIYFKVWYSCLKYSVGPSMGQMSAEQCSIYHNQK